MAARRCETLLRFHLIYGLRSFNFCSVVSESWTGTPCVTCGGGRGLAQTDGRRVSPLPSCLVVDGGLSGFCLHLFGGLRQKLF